MSSGLVVENKRPADIFKRRGRTAEKSFVADLAGQTHCEMHNPSEISRCEAMSGRCEDLTFFHDFSAVRPRLLNMSAGRLFSTTRPDDLFEITNQVRSQLTNPSQSYYS
jgi:hypothetical protein